MRHPNIVSLIAASFDGPYRCLVLEYMAEGTLDARLANLELPVLQWVDRTRILLHVARGLVYLHSLSPPVVHRDIQCRNVLLHHAEPDQSVLTAKVSIDFGESDRSECTNPFSVSLQIHCATASSYSYRHCQPDDRGGE